MEKQPDKVVLEKSGKLSINRQISPISGISI
jgi:hypothetical protein